MARALTLNGKVILPLKATLAGLRGHKVAAVYVLLSSWYERGSGEGWEHKTSVGTTRVLGAELLKFATGRGAAHVEFEDEDMDEDNLDNYLQMMAEARAAASPASSPAAPPLVDNTGLTGIVSLVPGG